MPSERKPEGADKLIREGLPGGPTVGYDPKKPGNYHLNNLGEVVYHGVPEGFHFVDGVLVPKGEDAPVPAAQDAPAPAEG